MVDPATDGALASAGGRSVWQDTAEQCRGRSRAMEIEGCSRPKRSAGGIAASLPGTPIAADATAAPNGAAAVSGEPSEGVAGPSALVDFRGVNAKSRGGYSPGRGECVGGAWANWGEVASIAGCVIGWYSFSLSLTAANKHLFDTLGFNFPLLVTFVHFLAISLLLHGAFAARGAVVEKCVVAARAGGATSSSGTAGAGVGPGGAPSAALRRGWWLWADKMGERPCVTTGELLRYVAPVGVLTALEIALSNYSYALVPLSTMTVVKSSIVVVVYVLSVACGIEPFCKKLLGAVVFIVWAIGLTVPRLEIRSVAGLAILALAVCCAALRWLFVHIQFRNLRFSPLQYMLLTQPLAAICLAVPATLMDLRRLVTTQVAAPDPRILLVALTVVSFSIALAFLVIFTEYTFVQKTSSLSLTVAGVGKEIVTILMSVVVFKERVSFTAAVGIVLSIVGIIFYTYLKRSQQLGAVAVGSENSLRDVEANGGAGAEGAPLPRLSPRAWTPLKAGSRGRRVAARGSGGGSSSSGSSSSDTAPGSDSSGSEDVVGAAPVAVNDPRSPPLAFSQELRG